MSNGMEFFYTPACVTPNEENHGILWEDLEVIFLRGRFRSYC